MPLSHAVVLIFLYAFGSLGAEYLKSTGFLDYPFYVVQQPGIEHVQFAVTQATVFSLTLLFGRLALGGVDFSSKLDLTIVRRLSEKRTRVYTLLGLMIFSLLITVVNWDQLVAEVSRRHAGNHNLSRLSLLIVIFSVVIFASGNYFFRVLSGFLIIYVGTMSGAVGASRSTALPFIFLGLMFLVNKNFFTGFAFLYLAIVAMRTAFAVRGMPSYSAYWDQFVFFSFSLELRSFLGVLMQYSLPGLSTVQASMSAPGAFSLESVGNFLLYLSPLPSSLLPDYLFADLSLSFVLGIDKSKLGINYDIFSESIFWFGQEFAWLYTVALAAIVLLPYFCAKSIAKIRSPYFYVLCFVVNGYMVVGGQVFALRAGSRAVIALCLLVIIYSVFRKTRLRLKEA